MCLFFSLRWEEVAHLILCWSCWGFLYLSDFSFVYLLGFFNVRSLVKLKTFSIYWWIIFWYKMFCLWHDRLRPPKVGLGAIYLPVGRHFVTPEKVLISSMRGSSFRMLLSCCLYGKMFCCVVRPWLLLRVRVIFVLEKDLAVLIHSFEDWGHQMHKWIRIFHLWHRGISLLDLVTVVFAIYIKYYKLPATKRWPSIVISINMWFVQTEVIIMIQSSNQHDNGS